MSSVREEQLVCDNSDSQGEEDFAIRLTMIKMMVMMIKMTVMMIKIMVMMIMLTMIKMRVMMISIIVGGEKNYNSDSQREEDFAIRSRFDMMLKMMTMMSMMMMVMMSMTMMMMTTM